MPDILAGAEPWTYDAGSAVTVGVLALHGFTGSPASMRVVAEACAADGMHVELPLLPGHGTTVADMVPTRWHDWTHAVELALDRLLDRASEVVIAGLSMGGTLSLATALRRPEVRALVLVNPATRPQDRDILDMLDELLDDGITTVPSIGSDIADPEGVEIGYDATPVAPLRSLQVDGLVPMVDRYHELTVPLRLFTSRDDHVVDPGDSEHLVAAYGGPVEHTWLERSYHVATQDHDRDLVVAGAVEFSRSVLDQVSSR